MYLRTLHRFFAVLFITLGTCMSAQALNSAKTLAPVAPIHPTSDHVQLDKTIANLLSYYHYRQAQLNDEQSSAILDAYVNALDPNRSFLLANDIKSFEKYRSRLDDYLQDGNLEPAYEIFNVYLRRLAERTTRLQTQLNRDINFNVNETLELDRKDQPWAKSKTELDDYWRKRLKNELLQLMLAGKELDAAKDTLRTRYEGRLRRTAQYNSEDVFQVYMNAVAASFDPHTSYFSPRASENFNIQMSLSLEGIGTVLRMEEEQISVVELVPGGPAALSGQLLPEDKIIGVGQGDEAAIVDVVGWRLDDVVELIRGPRGTVVRLEVLPAGSTASSKTVRLVRDKINLEKQAASSEIKTIQRDGQSLQIGIIVIPTFYSDFAAAQRGDRDYRSTTRDVRRLLTELQRQRVDGIVIDLRQNGGGSLQEAIELTGLFIPEGPVVQVRNSRGSIEVEEDPDPAVVYKGPLAVLVDQFSASASEIFAGAIQDYGRGVILGNPTFGKGTVQTLVDLNRFMPSAETTLGQLKLTVAKFYRINGSSTQHRGVTPDILFPSLTHSDEVGESSQDFALPWDEINPLRYPRYKNLDTLIPRLRQQHQQRAAHDPMFQTLLDDIEQARKERDRTRVSLLLSTRKTERDKAEQEQLERRNRWRALQGLPPLDRTDDDKTPDNQNADTEQPDPLLNESTQILADLVTFSQDIDQTLVMSQ
ncbi:MAG: carboxy terminal-processing peptidase [Candidatus Competibacteraceae bacterium]|nr:carboxy terminal-processing peptidase [Candidatus Competibacteraceae bacterium]